MKPLAEMHLVQYSFWEYESFLMSPGGSAFVGPNGAGKTSLADAVQIAMIGGHGQHLHFNAQSVQKDARSLRDYALGTMRSGEGDKGVLTRKRDEALSYITLVFRGENQGDVVTAGLCVWATANEKQHRVMGLFVLPGVALSLEDHLEDKGAHGKAPLDWQVFEAQARSRCAKAGRTATITSKPETYLNELLHSIQDVRQQIDPRRFLRALGHSINLKQVSSVGEFLRGYLVEATSIDKQGTLGHIKTVRQLIAQIEDVTEQIVRLKTIESRMRTVGSYYRTRAIASAARLLFQVEDADSRIGALSVEIDALGEAVGRAERAYSLRGEEERVAIRNHDNLYQQLVADPEQQDPAARRLQQQTLKSNAALLRKDVEGLDVAVRSATAALLLAFEGREADGLGKLRELSNQWEGRARRGELSTPAHVAEALELLGSLVTQVERLASVDGRAYETAKRHTGAVTAKMTAASQGVRIRDADVASAMALFSDEGIECRTVASHVTLKDVNWQGAVESFLGRNRHALIVEAGKEQAAVRLLRRSEIPEVTVVQPTHLRDTIGRQADPSSVASLLQSSNAVALAFLGRILGSMRRVETEAELEAHSRALTKDCMLSANGGTKRMRALAPNDWVLGVQVSTADKAELRVELEAARGAEGKALRLSSASRDADERVRACLAKVNVAEYSLALTAYEGASATAEAAADPATQQVSERLAALQATVKLAEDKKFECARAKNTAFEKMTELKGDLKTKEESLTEAGAQYSELAAKHAEALQDQDYDADGAQLLYDKYSESLPRFGLAEVLTLLQREVDQANKQLPTAQSTAQTEFVEFVNEHSFSVVDERSDWRKARTWSEVYKNKLQDSTLPEYRRQAGEAKAAAEAAFRSDVKYKLREALQRVVQEIRDLNRILDKCPPFTGGERYRFVANIANAHRPLYNLIVNQAEDGDSGSLFDAEVQDKLVSLMDACESGTDKGNNPLEDYRLFYNFDLEIRVDAEVVDLLSKRMGVASNGEHRVPFYVIAGAALATAYRIKPGEERTGGGVMILDEAFYGMDAQNTVVTAEFLRSLGLQLVMAGPDSDIGKLLPALESYHDLARFGPDVFVEYVVVKEKARRLLQADMPERNPELVAAKVQQLALSAG